MDVARTSRRWWRRAAVAAGAFLLVAVVPGRARAREQERPGEPWLPMVEEGAAPGEVYAKYALSVIHAGEEGWRVNRGPYSESVSRADFFVTVGRPDLAARERHSIALRLGLFWTGVSVALTGGLLMYATVSPGGFDPPAVWGLGTMGAGGLLVLLSSTVHGPVLTSDEVDGVVARYNDRLKAHIDEETGTVRPKPVQARLEMIAPFVDGQSGVGLLAIARF